MWNGQVAALENAFRPVLIDLPGFGSAGRAGRTDTPSLAHIADEVLEALRLARIVEPVVLVGLSMGGYIAFEFWNRHPEDLLGLVLVDTKASADSAETVETRHKTAKTAMAEGTEKAVASMKEKLLSTASQQSKELTDWLQSTMFSVAPETVEMAMLAMAERHDFTAKLASIDVPTLVVAGREDAIVPADVMKKMSDAIPNAAFHAVENAGHLTPIEQPQAFNQLLLDFLQKV
jgi:pimeloyl-ACP methyl ester carboxylesterase